MSIELNELTDEHPLVLELSSLRSTATRFQVLYIILIHFVINPTDPFVFNSMKLIRQLSNCSGMHS